jgi:thioredoxin 1
MMAPIFEQVARDFDGGVRFLKINTEEVPEVGQALGVRSIPTVVAMQGTEVVDSHVGLMPASALGRMARRVDEAARGVTLGDKVKSWLGLGPSPA